ncbi:MAG: L-aspartate oxidase, partial [Actinomycetota bacterium]|nr:L-aspartate oxidase [Actinomycetota bacterium]
PTAAVGNATRSAAAHGDPAKARERIQAAMTSCAGVARDAGSLADAHRHLVAAGSALDPADGSREGCETRNLLTVGSALVLAADARQETRGCHTRTDFPATEAALAHRLVIQ